LDDFHRTIRKRLSRELQWWRGIGAGRPINWKMYIIFAAFSGAAFIHIFLTAPETKGKTLEEIDEMFDSGRPAWKKPPEGSELDKLQKKIEKGNLKVITNVRQEVVEPKIN